MFAPNALLVGTTSCGFLLTISLGERARDEGGQRLAEELVGHVLVLVRVQGGLEGRVDRVETHLPPCEDRVPVRDRGGERRRRRRRAPQSRVVVGVALGVEDDPVGLEADSRAAVARRSASRPTGPRRSRGRRSPSSCTAPSPWVHPEPGPGARAAHGPEAEPRLSHVALLDRLAEVLVGLDRRAVGRRHVPGPRRALRAESTGDAEHGPAVLHGLRPLLRGDRVDAGALRRGHPYAGAEQRQVPAPERGGRRARDRARRSLAGDRHVRGDERRRGRRLAPLEQVAPRRGDPRDDERRARHRDRRRAHDRRGALGRRGEVRLEPRRRAVGVGADVLEEVTGRSRPDEDRVRAVHRRGEAARDRRRARRARHVLDCPDPSADVGRGEDDDVAACRRSSVDATRTSLAVGSKNAAGSVSILGPPLSTVRSKALHSLPPTPGFWILDEVAGASCARRRRSSSRPRRPTACR